jgi:Uma2 family endonuclease
VLKDVLGESLADIADMLETSVDSVGLSSGRRRAAYLDELAALSLNSVDALRIYRVVHPVLLPSRMNAGHGTLLAMSSDERAGVPKAPPGQDELPSCDGEPMETARHRDQSLLLTESLWAYWADRRDVFVGGNMFVYFSELQTRGSHFRGPDVFVVLDAQYRTRKSWVMWEEDGRLPDVVIELLSDTTRHIDRGEKMRIYAQIWKTSVYVLYDPISRELEGYTLDSSQRKYVPLARDARGDIPVDVLGLSLGERPGDVNVEPGPFLRWIDTDGRPLPSGTERAEAERKRADAAQERADAAQERADAAQERADAERERADAERERADATERRLRELEAALAHK